MLFAVAVGVIVEKASDQKAVGQFPRGTSPNLVLLRNGQVMNSFGKIVTYHCKIDIVVVH